MGPGNIAAVFVFEWKRALTVPRLAWWAVLALFPVFIVTLIRLSPAPSPPREFWIALLFALVPMLVTMLGTFLWTASAVSAELERRSWLYLAVRPNGTTAVLLGKYLAAVTWVLPAALVGLTVAVVIALPEEWWRIWITLAWLVCLSCPAYAAVYLLLGTLFPTRSMVMAVAYTLTFELVISFVPAMINKLTVQYRLRALLLDWADITISNSQDFRVLALISDAPARVHVSVLVAYVMVLLIAAMMVIRWREFSAAGQSDV